MPSSWQNLVLKNEINKFKMLAVRENQGKTLIPLLPFTFRAYSLKGNLPRCLLVRTTLYLPLRRSLTHTNAKLYKTLTQFWSTCVTELKTCAKTHHWAVWGPIFRSVMVLGIWGDRRRRNQRPWQCTVGHRYKQPCCYDLAQRGTIPALQTPCRRHSPRQKDDSACSMVYMRCFHKSAACHVLSWRARVYNFDSHPGNQTVWIISAFPPWHRFKSQLIHLQS